MQQFKVLISYQNFLTCVNRAIKFHSNNIIVFQVLIIKEQWKEYSILNIFSDARLTVRTMKIGCRFFQNQETTRRMKIGDTCKTHTTTGINITINLEKLSAEAWPHLNSFEFTGLTPYWAQVDNQDATQNMCKQHWYLTKKRK